MTHFKHFVRFGSILLSSELIRKKIIIPKPGNFWIKTQLLISWVMGTSDINIKEWFCPNQSVDKKNHQFLVVFEVF